MMAPLFSKFALTLVSVAALGWSLPALAGSNKAMGRPNPVSTETVPEITDRVIVRLRNMQNANGSGAALGAARKLGVELKPLRRLNDGGEVMQLNRALGRDAMRALIKALKDSDANIMSVEPDHRMVPLFTPNDPLFPRQWNLRGVLGGLNLPAAWELSTGSGVVVAVLDTGVLPHADLAPNLLSGYDFVRRRGRDGDSRDADARDPGDWYARGDCLADPLGSSDSTWHGTHVAGTIGAVAGNAMGMTGVAFGAKVLPVRVLGRCGGYTSDIADALVWASGGAVDGAPANPTPARVINLSLGGRGVCSSAYQNAIDSARARGAVVVVAAGNDGADAAQYQPASCRGVIAVGATLRDGSRAPYSNTGATVDVYAPGGDVSRRARQGILSTLNDGVRAPGQDAYAYYNGTSMAAPHVAGVAALLLARQPSLTPDQVEGLLKSTARAVSGDCPGCAGAVDAAAALSAAGR